MAEIVVAVKAEGLQLIFLQGVTCKRPQKNRATSEHLEKRSRERNVDNSFQL